MTVGPSGYMRLDQMKANIPPHMSAAKVFVATYTRSDAGAQYELKDGYVTNMKRDPRMA